MFCPYPSIFDKPVRAERVRRGTRAVRHRVSARTRGGQGEVQKPGGLAPSETWRTLVRVVCASLALVAAPILSSLAGGLPRTGDHDYEPPAAGSYTLPVVKAAADGEVLDSRGRALRLNELTRGRVTVMSFIYTRCAAAKACPYATGILNQLHRLSAENETLSKNLRLVSLSFDPAGDTPQRMAAYSAWGRGRESAAEWHFITTRSQAELQPILAAYGQAVDRKENAADPTGPLNHTLRVFLIDRDGNIRNIYSSGTLDVRLVLADVKTLLLEETRIATRQPPRR